MRGLKRLENVTKTENIRVASFTDAWIETPSLEGHLVAQPSHLLQMRGLKQPKI